MARVPRKLTVQFSADSGRDLAEIWEWNVKTRSERQADDYVRFLRSETRKLGRSASPGRVIPSNSTLRYHTIKRRAGGYGHVVIFWIENDILHVFRYFHTSQDWERKIEGLPDSEDAGS